MNLLPCPFCGGSDIRFTNHGKISYHPIHHADDVWSMCCYNCGVKFPNCYSKELFVKKWNTRTPPPAVWHRASEKLPTGADGDYQDRVWVYFLEAYVHPRMRLVPVGWAMTVEGDFFWTPTNFTKPKPPEV